MNGITSSLARKNDLCCWGSPVDTATAETIESVKNRSTAQILSFTTFCNLLQSDNGISVNQRKILGRHLQITHDHFGRLYRF